MASTVNARIPLSLLEAIRRMDTPEDHTETEYVPELRNKRLGLSDTVYTQIRRYSDAMKRGQRIPFAEAEGLGTLIGRRPDADELYRAAGTILAKDIYDSIPGHLRWTIRTMPRFVSRPLAFGQVNKAVERYFGGTVERSGSYISLKIPESVTVNGAADSAGCLFYEVAFGELLKLLSAGGELVDHVHCAQRGDSRCAWRAEWRG